MELTKEERTYLKNHLSNSIKNTKSYLDNYKLTEDIYLHKEEFEKVKIMESILGKLEESANGIYWNEKRNW